MQEKVPKKKQLVKTSSEERIKGRDQNKKADRQRLVWSVPVVLVLVLVLVVWCGVMWYCVVWCGREDNMLEDANPAELVFMVWCVLVRSCVLQTLARDFEDRTD